MTFAIRPDRTLVVSGRSPRSCLPHVQMVYVVSPRVLQVLLADDATGHCTPAAHDPGRPKPVRFRIPAGIELDRAAYVDLVGPLAASPRFPARVVSGGRAVARRVISSGASSAPGLTTYTICTWGRRDLGDLPLTTSVRSGRIAKVMAGGLPDGAADEAAWPITTRQAPAPGQRDEGHGCHERGAADDASPWARSDHPRQDRRHDATAGAPDATGRTVSTRTTR